MPEPVRGGEPHAGKRTRNGGAVVERRAPTFSPQDDPGFPFSHSFLAMYGSGECEMPACPSLRVALRGERAWPERCALAREP